MSDPAAIRVYVNSAPVELPPGADGWAAVRAADAALAERLGQSRAYLTDGRGIELDPAAPLRAGAILRVVMRSARGTAGESGGAAG